MDTRAEHSFNSKGVPMCEPTTLALLSLGITTAGSVAGLGAQAATSKSQAAARDAQAEEIRKAELANYDQLQIRQQQETQAAGQQIQANQIDAAKARSTATVAAGEAGVSGLSVEALLADLYGQEARFKDGVTQNLENVTDSLSLEAENIQRTSTSQTNNLPTPDRPDYIGAGLRIANAAAGFTNRVS